MFLNAIICAVALTGPFQGTPRPEPIWPSGPILGSSTADEAQGLRLRLTKFEQEIVWSDATEADKLIRVAGLETKWSEQVRRGTEKRSFFLDGTDPVGIIGERSRRILGRALWRRVREFGLIPPHRRGDQVFIYRRVKRGLGIRTAFSGDDQIDWLRRNFRKVPETLFQFGPESQGFQVFVIRGREELGFGMAFRQDWKKLSRTLSAEWRNVLIISNVEL